MYNPVVDRIVEWLINYAKPVNPYFYWIGIYSISLLGGIVFAMWVQGGFNDVKMLFAVTLIIFVFWVVAAFTFFKERDGKNEK